MRSMVVVCLSVILCACGGSGSNQAAVDACLAEASKRLAGKSFEIDSKQLEASAVSAEGEDGMFHLSTSIVFDAGLASEFTQIFNCKVRQDAAGASVISLEFIWSMDDLNMPK